MCVDAYQCRSPSSVSDSCDVGAGGDGTKYILYYGRGCGSKEGFVGWGEGGCNGRL